MEFLTGSDFQDVYKRQDQGYPVTFIIMFLAALLTGSLATQLKNHAKQSAQAAYRTKVLFDTNQILQQEKNQEDVYKRQVDGKYGGQGGSVWRCTIGNVYNHDYLFYYRYS